MVTSCLSHRYMQHINESNLWRNNFLIKPEHTRPLKGKHKSPVLGRAVLIISNNTYGFFMIAKVVRVLYRKLGEKNTYVIKIN